MWREGKIQDKDNLSIKDKLNLVLMKFDGKRLTEIWETKINYSKLKKPQTNRRLELNSKPVVPLWFLNEDAVDTLEKFRCDVGDGVVWIELQSALMGEL